MLTNIKEICNTCKSSDVVLSDRGKEIISCNHKTCIGKKCFESNKLDLVKNPYNELEINTKYSSYVKFIIEYDNQISKMHEIRSNSVKGLLYGSVVFDMDIYKKIDLLFTKWGSWYSRVIMTLKTLLISGHYCPNFIEFSKATIKDYYNASDTSVICDISESLIEAVNSYLDNMKIPTHNGEFIEALHYISEGLTYIYKIMIIQYANEYQIKHDKNIMYFSSDFRKISSSLEKNIVERRMEQLLELHDNIELKFPNSCELYDINSNEIIKDVFEKYKDKITNYENF